MELNEAMWRLSRAARELLGWTQIELAERAGVSVGSIKKYEQRKTSTVGMTNTLRFTFQEAGIKFILSDEPGVEELGVVLRIEPDKK